MELQFYLFINALFNCIMLEYLPFALLQFRYKFNKYYALAGIVLIDMIVTFPRIFLNQVPSTFSIVLSITYPPIFCVILFKDPLWKKIATTIGFYFIVMYPLEFITMHFMHVFWGGNYFADVLARNEIYTAGLTLNNQFYFIILIFITLLWRRYIDHKKSSHMPVYMAISIYHTILFAVWLKVAVIYSKNSMLPGLLFEVIGFGINIILFYFFNQMEQKLETEEKLASLYRQRDFEKEYMETSKRHLEQMKKLHNDFASQIHELHETVKQPDYEKDIREILNRSRENLDAGRQTIHSLHPVINALLSVKKALAENKKIDMEIHCTHSSDIGIEDLDICSVLGNLLDNAIEACEKVETGERKIITDINEKSGFLIIKVSNTITPRTPITKKIMYTSKPDTENHGLGLRLVDRICSKYEGRLLLTPSEDTMHTSAILKKANSQLFSKNFYKGDDYASSHMR